MRKVAASVAALVAVLLGVYFLRTTDGGGFTPVANTRIQIEQWIPGRLERYRADMNSFPSTDQGLQALRRAPIQELGQSPRWMGPYVDADIQIRDAWGREIRYAFPGVHNARGFDLWSLGPDESSADDDITNWRDG